MIAEEIEYTVGEISSHKLQACPCSSFCGQLSSEAQMILGESMVKFTQKAVALGKSYPSMKEEGFFSNISRGAGTPEQLCEDILAVETGNSKRIDKEIKRALKRMWRELASPPTFHLFARNRLESMRVRNIPLLQKALNDEQYPHSNGRWSISVRDPWGGQARPL